MKTIWEIITKDEEWRICLRNLLVTNNKALFRAIILIYDKQSEEEKAMEKSINEDGEGFSKYDAKYMSKVAKKLKSGKELSYSEIAMSRVIMPRYWRQLMKISKENIARRNLKAAETAEAELEYEKEREKERAEIEKCSEQGEGCSYGICDECKYKKI